MKWIDLEGCYMKITGMVLEREKKNKGSTTTRSERTTPTMLLLAAVHKGIFRSNITKIGMLVTNTYACLLFVTLVLKESTQRPSDFTHCTALTHHCG
jgi:hypothetical protein